MPIMPLARVRTLLRRRSSTGALPRPVTASVLVLVFAAGLGAGAFAHLVTAGDHHANEVAARVQLNEGRAGYLERKQLAVQRGILDTGEAQMRSDGILKGLLVAAVLFLAAIAAILALWFASTIQRPRRPEDGPARDRDAH